MTSALITMVWAVGYTSAGEVLAGGNLILSPVLLGWNGSSWQSPGPLTAALGGTVRSLLELPNGDVLAAGRFSSASGVSVGNIARRTSTGWVPAAATPSSGADHNIYALQMQLDGTVAVGGAFATVSGLASGRLAFLVPTCLPAVQPSGGCPSSGGNNLLTALTLPWVDTHFRARGTGLPTNAIVIVVTGLSAFVPPVPLDQVFAIGQPGCELRPFPDLLDVVVTTTGTAESSLFLLNTPPLVGVTFYHQMVPIEVDAQGAWVSVTATNALQLTAGTF
jgi:hypothetical protein